MPRQDKIRKRGCSSSSSSSLAQSYRLKRAILVGKRRGSSTPVPTWKVNNTTIMKSSGGGLERGKVDELVISASARKLGATLWDINEAPPAKEEEKSKMGLRREKTSVKSSSKLGSVPTNLLSDPPSHIPVSEKMDGTKGASHRRRGSVNSQKVQLNGGLDSAHKTSLTEVEAQPSIVMACSKTGLKDTSKALKTSRELVKVLNHLWGCGGEKHSMGLSLISALKSEIDRALGLADKLIQEHKSSRGEIEWLRRQLKEQERVQSVVMAVAGEMKVEKKLRRQSERLNKKLGLELADAKISLSKAVKDLQGEKRAREILEQVCDELARRIGEDRAEVEELKRESAKVKEEVEKEREMLQMADVLREERVQMKLSEAKYQFEEKNAAVDKLRSELEDYLRSTIQPGKNRDNNSKSTRIKELEEYLRKTLVGNGQSEKEKKEEDEEDSTDCELHSIELNMESKCTGYEWIRNDPVKRRSSSFLEERQSSGGIEWEFTDMNNDRLRDRDYEEDEIQRYKMIKDLRDHIVESVSAALPSSKEIGLAMLQEAV